VTLVSAAGRLSHAQVVGAVRRYAGRLRPGGRPPFRPFGGVQERPQVRLFRRETAQTQMALGIRTCSRHDERRFALRVLNTILGENMSSRLFQVVREDRALAYAIQSSLSYFDDVGTLIISAGLDAGNLTKALRLIMVELRRCTRVAPTSTELRRARDYLIGQLDLGLESTENQMTWIGEQLLAYGKILSPAEAKRHLGEVTTAQIRAAAREFIRPQRMSLAVVSWLKSAHGLADLLSR
jgi:predicted Zn-dependent peptidase